MPSCSSHPGNRPTSPEPHSPSTADTPLSEQGITRAWNSGVHWNQASATGSSTGYAGHGVTASYVGGRTLAELAFEQETPRTSLPWSGTAHARGSSSPSGGWVFTACTGCSASPTSGKNAGTPPPPRSWRDSAAGSQDFTNSASPGRSSESREGANGARRQAPSITMGPAGTPGGVESIGAPAGRPLRSMKPVLDLARTTDHLWVLTHPVAGGHRVRVKQGSNDLPGAASDGTVV
jgi:hypothetical protein